jgi:ABC-2 type transport system permease protein
VSNLDGTWALLRLAARRDRVRLPIWVVSVVGVTYGSGLSIPGTFPSRESMESYGSSVSGSPALVAMTGPPIAVDTLPGIVINQVSLTALVAMALVAILTVVRHTRGEEEEGRSEVLRATVVGRHAGSASAMLLTAVLSVVMGAGCAVALLGSQVPSSASWLFGASVTALGLTFGAVALVAAQVFTHTRAASGLSLAVLGVAFVIRAVGDVQESWLVWLSPIGWSQAVHPLGADQRWWPLVVPLVAVGVLAGLAVVLADRRDVGAGLVPDRPGSATASRLLAGPVALGFRLQRGALIGWAVGMFLFAASMGSLSREIDDMARDNPTLVKYLEATGAASLTDSYFSTMLLIMAVVAAGFAVSSVLRLRSEETSGRLEVLLATGLTRTRWLLGSLVVTLAGAVLLLFLSGLGMGLAYGLVISDPSQPFRLALMALVYVPATAALAALAVLLTGWLPRATGVAWAALGYCMVLAWLGGVLDVPAWVDKVSPYWQTPAVPVDQVTLTAPLLIALVAVGVGLLGLIGFRRRDVVA